MSRQLRGSKIAYEFSKSTRFQRPHYECPVAFYKGPAGKDPDARAPSFGYGERCDFTRSITDRKTPDPCKYSPPVETSRGTKYGHTFGLSRELVLDKSYQEYHRKSVPGVGSYKFQPKGDLPSFTMRRRTKDLERTQLSFLKDPGPGAYELKSSFPTQGKAISGPRSPRFESERPGLGPGAYNLLELLKGGSERQGSVNLRSSRLQWADKQVPGPGAYSVPLQFGEEPMPTRRKFFSSRYK